MSKPPQSPPAGGPEGARIFDELTGVYSIDYFEHQLQQQIAYSLRHVRPLSIVLFAVDYVEELTEGFGREARDGILARVAEVVKEHVREEDVLARYGLAEFALLCRDTPQEAAGFLATRIRQSVESAGLSHAGLELPVTVSLGVAALTLSGDEHSAMVQRAEDALARARATGNCTVVADDAAS